MKDQPTNIGRYEVERLLGAGGMGAVYLARDPAIGRRVAIKVLRTDDDEYRRRFKVEVTSAGALRHRNISMLFDSGEHDGSPFLAMEFIPGETLAEKIKRREPLPVPERLRYVEELCEGLAHAHKHGIVHRDIKPANIIVDADSNSVKIVDFGIARVSDSAMTQSGLVMGTISYMSPEQVMGKRVDQRSDIFSVGLVLYELLSFRRAFPGGMDDGVMYRIVHEEPESLATVVPNLDEPVLAIVARALKKDPVQRFADAASMAAALRTARARLDVATDVGTIKARPQFERRPPPAFAPAPISPVIPAPAVEPQRIPEPVRPPNTTAARPAPGAALRPAPVIGPALDAPAAPPVPEPLLDDAPREGDLRRTVLIGGGAILAAVLVGLLVWSLGRGTLDPPAVSQRPVEPAKVTDGRRPGASLVQPPATTVPPSTSRPVTQPTADPRLRISGPSDLVLLLDGKPVSRDAPVSAGDHTLVARLPGVFGAVQQQFRIASGETRALAVDGATGTLAVGELPFPFGSVTIDGRRVTNGARALATALTAEFIPDQRSTGGLPRRKIDVTVSPGRQTDLAALVPQGRLRFEVSPAATVAIAYQRFATATQGELAHIAEGAYTVSLERPGYPDFTAKADVRGGQETVLRYAYNFATGTWIAR